MTMMKAPPPIVDTRPEIAGAPVDFASLWSLGGLTFRQLSARSIAGYRQHHLDARSAQFAFYAMLALAPLLIVVIAIVAWLPIDGERVLASFRDAVGAGMPDNVFDLVMRQIEDIQRRSSLGLIGIGLVLLAIAGSRMLMTVSAGLDAAYGYQIEQRRHFWKTSGLAFALTWGAFVLFLAAMVLQVVGPVATEAIVSRVEAAWVHVLLSKGVRWGVVCAFMLLVTSIIYWLMPTAKVRWHWVSPGSLFATVGWVAVTQGFRLYVENVARYNETYGTLGGVVVLLIWLYFTGAVLMMGGQIDSVIQTAAGKSRQDEPRKG
jgi:membrane protein